MTEIMVGDEMPSVLTDIVRATRLRAARLMAASDDEILMVAREFADWVNDNFPSAEEMALEHAELIAQHEECAKDYRERLIRIIKNYTEKDNHDKNGEYPCL